MGYLFALLDRMAPEASLIMRFGLLARGAPTLFAFPLATRYWSSQTVILILITSSLLATILYIPSSSFGTLFVVTIIFSTVYPALLPAVDSSYANFISGHD